MNANANFHSFSGDVFAEQMTDPRFAAYRKAWEQNPTRHVAGFFPLHLDIEITNRCNLKCAGCARTSAKWCAGGVGDMGMDLFKRIVDEGERNGLCSLKLSLRGESMLHPQLFDMIAYAFDHGVLDLYFNTNGTLLTRRNCVRIVQSGMKRISISVDGWDKSSFERYREGARYEQVVAGIDNLLAVREELSSAFPKIRVQTVLFPEAVKHLDRFQAVWADRVDEIAGIDARDEGDGVDHRGKHTCAFACPFLWQRMVVLYDGTLLPCLMHGVQDAGLLALGRVQEVSIAEQWCSDRLERLRQLHVEGSSHRNEACDRCSYRDVEIRKAQRASDGDSESPQFVS